MLPFEQQQRLIEEVSCLHKEAEKKKACQQSAKQQFCTTVMCSQCKQNVDMRKEPFRSAAPKELFRN